MGAESAIQEKIKDRNIGFETISKLNAAYSLQVAIQTDFLFNRLYVSQDRAKRSYRLMVHLISFLEGVQRLFVDNNLAL